MEAIVHEWGPDALEASHVYGVTADEVPGVLKVLQILDGLRDKLGRDREALRLALTGLRLARVVLDMAEGQPASEEQRSREALERFEVGQATLETLKRCGVITQAEYRAEFVRLANETRAAVGLKPLEEVRFPNPTHPEGMAP